MRCPTRDSLSIFCMSWLISYLRDHRSPQLEDDIRPILPRDQDICCFQCKGRLGWVLSWHQRGSACQRTAYKRKTCWLATPYWFWPCRQQVEPHQRISYWFLCFLWHDLQPAMIGWWSMRNLEGMLDTIYGVAGSLASMCHACQMHLGEASSSLNPQVKPVDVVQNIQQSWARIVNAISDSISVKTDTRASQEGKGRVLLHILIWDPSHPRASPVSCNHCELCFLGHTVWFSI